MGLLMNICNRSPALQLLNIVFCSLRCMFFWYRKGINFAVAYGTMVLGLPLAHTNMVSQVCYVIRPGLDILDELFQNAERVLLKLHENHFTIQCGKSFAYFIAEIVEQFA